jgi:hypothetical protein
MIQLALTAADQLMGPRFSSEVVPREGRRIQLGEETLQKVPIG